MTKSNYKPTTTIVQDKIPNINDPGYDIEDEFHRKINKIRGIAELILHVDYESRPVFSSAAYHGISYMLIDTAEELRKICLKMWEGGAK